MTFFNYGECECNPFRGLHHEMLKKSEHAKCACDNLLPTQSYKDKCHPHLIGGTVAVCKGFASIGTCLHYHSDAAAVTAAIVRYDARIMLRAASATTSGARRQRMQL